MYPTSVTRCNKNNNITNLNLRSKSFWLVYFRCKGPFVPYFKHIFQRQVIKEVLKTLLYIYRKECSVVVTRVYTECTCMYVPSSESLRTYSTIRLLVPTYSDCVDLAGLLCFEDKACNLVANMKSLTQA